MATSRDFSVRRALPPQCDADFVTKELADMNTIIQREAEQAGFVLDWAGVAINTDVNQIDTSSLGGTYYIETYTTITTTVLGVKAD